MTCISYCDDVLIHKHKNIHKQIYSVLIKQLVGKEKLTKQSQHSEEIRLTVELPNIMLCICVYIYIFCFHNIATTFLDIFTCIRMYILISTEECLTFRD